MYRFSRKFHYKNSGNGVELLINLGGLLKLLLISKLGVTFNSEDSLHFVEAILCESVKLSGLLGV